MSAAPIVLSVVVPSYDDAVLLRGCLQALAVQTRMPDEIIVVDNGSHDDTAAVAREFGAAVVTEPQRGVLHATAAGFDAASGSLLGRLDADSRPQPDWAARVVRRFEADPTLGGLTGTGEFYGRGPVWRFIGRYVYLGGYFLTMRLVLGRLPLFGSSFALRREVWHELRPRLHLDDPRAHDDLDITAVLSPATGVDFDRGLRVQVSARPFDDFAGFRRRASWAFHMLAVNLREVSWGRRVVACARGRRMRRMQRRAPLRAGR
ncbi:glycosyltransferase family 2 protein [Microbacterium sp. NPDC057659]|uniref:glycosyltransferase family 2 protein n=1 Tax=Microbacterium sp. NPDC057659 TaxID=3346198 RepID=UPI00366C4B94